MTLSIRGNDMVDPGRDRIGVFLIHREGGGDERNAFVELAVSAVVD